MAETYSKEFRDVLYEAVIDFINYTDITEVVDYVYTDKTKEFIENKMGIDNKEQFASYFKSAFSKPMKHAEMAIDLIVKTIMGIQLKKDRKTLIDFIQKYYDSNFTGEI